MDSIKVRRALHKAHIPLNSAKATSVYGAVPASVQAKLNSEELADLYAALAHYWHLARRHTEWEIVRKGCVWDAAQSKLREIAA